MRAAARSEGALGKSQPIQRTEKRDERLSVELYPSTQADVTHERPSDWGSLVADLSTAPRPAWSIHDRTHLEFAVDYHIDAKNETSTYEWEAYFFVPESLRLDDKTYDKQDIYADLQSYIRFAVPEVPFGDLAGEPLAKLRSAIEKGNADSAMREMRLYACLVRAAGVQNRRLIHASLTNGADSRSSALASIARMVADARRITSGLREVLALVPEDDDSLVTAASWIDEDVSRVIETIFGSLAVVLANGDAPLGVQQLVVDAAVEEARYRSLRGLDGVGRLDADKREIEHLEFRRHVLKRFTSSVLWLKAEVREGARMVLEALYALAAGVAMAFAIAATILSGNPMDSERIWMWSIIAVLAYMGKDRIKAALQNVFSKAVLRHFPDRRWRIRDRERGVVLGKVHEQSGFVTWQQLPEAVLAQRRTTRKHPLEEQARPERVLWHKKVVLLDGESVAHADARFDALTEIFRLDLRRWLAHTDDPKRKIVFADPEQQKVCSATAPRVYNIGVVYRLRKKSDDHAPWHRIRVVVTRKGIRRIDHIH
jgi:hypothetical protein